MGKKRAAVFGLLIMCLQEVSAMVVDYLRRPDKARKQKLTSCSRESKIPEIFDTASVSQRGP